MPEREFELYLDLLGRLLRLRPEQRAEIADELRDHLEARLDELTAAGLSREAAIRRALEEFGDGAGLASHFTTIAREKRRRLIMRCTLGTVAVTAVVLLALSAFWPPDAGVNLPGRVAAQGLLDPPATDADLTSPRSDPAEGDGRDETIPQVEAKLDKRIEVVFEDRPLSDLTEYVGDAIGVDILLNRKSLEDIGVQSDVPFTLQLRHTMVPARTALDVVLEQFDLGYVIRDGFIYVVSAEDAELYEFIEVYNVRDLLEDFRDEAAPRQAATSDTHLSVQTVQFSSPDEPPPASPAERLIEVIMNSVGSAHWEEIDGIGGTISEFNGLLVIRSTQQGHREIKELLKMMRAAHQEQAPRRAASRPKADPRERFGSARDPASLPSADSEERTDEGFRPRQP